MDHGERYRQILEHLERSKEEDECRRTSSHEVPTLTKAKMRMASHPGAKPYCLTRLSEHAHAGIVKRVAENANTPASVLSRLVAHPDPDVRIALTENTGTPESILIMLAADENDDVRFSLAENHNAPRPLLELLSKDNNPYIASRAGKTLERLGFSSVVQLESRTKNASRRASSF